MQRTVDILWRSMWILCMTSSLSSHSTSASVSELSRLVTHTAVSSPKCNSEKRPLSNSVAFQTLFKWHRYCGIFKIHIVRKINTGIRYEPVYRPALVCVCVCVCLQEPLLFSLIHTAFLSLISCSSNVVRTVWRVFPKINLVVSWLLSSLKDLLTYCSSTCAVVFSFLSWSVYKGNYRTWSNGMHQVWRRCVNLGPLV